jgi:subtilisin family serine protease
VCRPQDQEEYQTLLSNGRVPLSAGAGVRLFVIDTGTTPSHPDLDVAVCRDVTGRRARNGCDDGDGHGTHTSGSAAASAGRDGLGLIGGAPGATLGVIKICDGLCFTDALVRGIEEAVKRRADIISLSFAASDSEPLRNAVVHAVESGVLFLAAAGNAGPFPNSIVYPAAYPDVVAVGMLDPSRILSPFSSRGVDDGDDGAVSDRELELVSGGFLVESTWTDGCYRVLSGTSMSTPAVAGLAAANWKGDAASTRAWLVEEAEDIDNSSRVPEVDPSSTGWDAVSGYGLGRLGGVRSQRRVLRGADPAGGERAGPGHLPDRGDLAFGRLGVGAVHDRYGRARRGSAEPVARSGRLAGLHRRRRRPPRLRRRLGDLPPVVDGIRAKPGSTRPRHSDGSGYAGFPYSVR